MYVGLGIDFDSNAFNITFEAGENFGSYNLSITCDKLIEGEEIFYVTLTSDDPQITINDDTALVAIIDSTSKSCLIHCINLTSL